MPSSFPVRNSILQPDETRQAEDIPDEDEDDASTSRFCSELSLNDTASNLTGPGRTIGLLYSHLGRGLEFIIGRLAHQSGFGPKAVASRIERVDFEGVKVSGDDEPGRLRRVVRWTVRDGSEAKLYSDCRKLAKYATAEVWETRVEALFQVNWLVAIEPRLRAFFNTEPIRLDLKHDKQASYILCHGSASLEDERRKHESIVDLSKQVLLAIEDSPLNNIIEEVLQMSFIHEDTHPLEINKCKHIMRELLEYCRDPRYQFMAGALILRAMECANNFATSLEVGFGQLGKATDLDEFIELHRDILRLLPNNHPRRSWCLDLLAICLRTRFKQYGRTVDIDEAIKHHRASLQLLPDSHPERSLPLADLELSRRMRFNLHGQTADDGEAIEHLQASLRLLPKWDPYSNPQQSLCRYLKDTAKYCQSRVEHHGQIADICEAIQQHRAALQLLPINHPIRSICRSNLVKCLQSRSKHNGRITDISRSIGAELASRHLASCCIYYGLRMGLKFRRVLALIPG